MFANTTADPPHHRDGRQRPARRAFGELTAPGRCRPGSPSVPGLAARPVVAPNRRHVRLLLRHVSVPKPGRHGHVHAWAAAAGLDPTTRGSRSPNVAAVRGAFKAVSER